MLFLDKFPKVIYDINKGARSNFERVTDLTFRVSFLKEILDNTSAYYEYVVRDGDTPEILADRFYNNSELHWIILYANDIYDPQYDWPLNYDAFQKYIITKYGSISNAKIQIHHYEKIIARQVEGLETIYLDRQYVDYNASVYLSCTYDNATSNISSIFIGQDIKQVDPDTNNTIFIGTITENDLPNNRIYLSITEGKLTNYITLFDASNNDNLCRVVTNTHENIDFYLNLPIEPQLTTYTINNKRVIEGISRNAVSAYDYELEQNERKRNIKVIKKEYIGQIQFEFNNITKSDPTFIRRLNR